MIFFIAEKQINELNNELFYKTKMIADKLENVAKTGCVDTYQRIIEGEEDKNPEVSGGQTFLHLVAKHGHKELCEAIIENLLEKYSHSDDILKTLDGEADVASMHLCNLQGRMPRNSKDQTPLHIAAIHGQSKIFELFIDKLIDETNWQWAQLDDRQWTPLHYAAMMGNEKICSIILKNFAEHKPTDYVDLELQSPLHVAVHRGHFNICKLLTDYQASLDLKDSIGFTPLHIAAHRGNEDICEFLIDRMVDINPTDSDGRTPLHIAAFEGHYKVCELFVICCLESTDEYLNPKDFKGWTPLHGAAFNGREDVCELLLQNVSDTKPKDSEGLSPLDISKQRKNKSTSAIFKSFYKKHENKKKLKR